MGGLWHYIYELFINILRVLGVIAFEFFSPRIVCVSDVDVPCVVSIAEDLTEGGGVPPPSDGNFVRLVERGVPPPNGGMLFVIVCQI
jgi:hypothetical protein